MKEPSTQWISWIDNNDKFRIGGVLSRHNIESDGGQGFVKEQERLKKKQYVLYRIAQGQVLSLNLKTSPPCNCEHIKEKPHIHPYAKRVFIKRQLQLYNKPARIPDKVSQFKAKHAVSLKDKDGEMCVVYYHRDPEKRTRFMSSHKYRLAKQYGWEFKEPEMEAKAESKGRGRGRGKAKK